MKALKFKTTLFLLFASTSAYSQSVTTGELDRTEYADEAGTMYIFGSREQTFEETGAAHHIDQKELEKFSYEDIHKVLKRVPGVNIQEEDGAGLRPNIGMRGTQPHRSKKVTLMEDGVLIAPAPYAAPAAYYFPLPTRMKAVEVFKGPSSVKYGPNSIGGAVNLVTKGFGDKNVNQFNGMYGIVKTASLTSAGKSYAAQFHRLDSDGFKTLPGGQDTGFVKNDFSVKTRLLNKGKNKLDLKLGFNNEVSNETYLGLNSTDFSADAFQRYSASQNDQLNAEHRLVHLTWETAIGSDVDVSTTAYYHEFDRAWDKVTRFKDGPELRDVTADPTGSRRIFYETLTGSRDSSLADGADKVIMGDNARTYYSRGIQTNFTAYLDDPFGAEHALNLGIRLHNDRVKRNHTEAEYLMSSGNLVRTDSERIKTTQNQDEARALTVFLEDEVLFGNLKIRAGTRFERAEYESTNFTTGVVTEDSESHFVPGLSTHYKINDQLGILAGVNKGLTIVGPNQSDDIQPEESINYEAGFRYNGVLYSEVIGFYSDYENIKGTCTFSSGCAEDQLDQGFNGNQARIFGVEAVFDKEFRAGKWGFQTSFNYTFTRAEFEGNVFSNNPEWGIGLIREGDPLPYIPQHQYSFQAGLSYAKLNTNLDFNWMGKMFDQSVWEGRRKVAAHGVVNWSANYNFTKNFRVNARVENILGSTYVVSFRPFGARPGKPRIITGGLTYIF